MSVNKFTDDQVLELRKNPYVKNCSNKGITYDISFKEFFIEECNKGNDTTDIFISAGFDPKVLGSRRMYSFADRVKKQNERFDGFKDRRKGSSGRPKVKDLTPEQHVEILENKVNILKQENDFLKRVRYINKQQIAKQSKNRQ